MSADNWTVCPQCKYRRDRDIASERERVQSLYGTVDAVEYLKALGDLSIRESTRLDETLREDYWIGVDKDGLFKVSYDCGCQCGFTYAFSDKWVAWTEPKDTGLAMGAEQKGGK
jgi:hypothetical protein